MVVPGDYFDSFSRIKDEPMISSKYLDILLILKFIFPISLVIEKTERNIIVWFVKFFLFLSSVLEILFLVSILFVAWGFLLNLFTFFLLLTS